MTIAPPPTETPAPRRVTASKTAAEPSTWQLRVAALAAESARLKADLAAQAIRIDDLAKLETRRAEILAAMESESMPFLEASAALSENTTHRDALRWTSEKRGEAARVAVREFRDNLMNSKRDLLAAANRAAGAAVAVRQSAVAALVASWDNTMPPESPLPILTVTNACPVCRTLDKHRVALESWLPDHGPGALLAVAGPAADFLASVPVPPEIESRTGAPGVEIGASMILGSNGASAMLETVAILDSPAEAVELFQDLTSRSGFAGMHRLYRLPHVFPSGSADLPADAVRGRDLTQNGAFGEQYPSGSGIDAGFITQTLTWLDSSAK